MGLLLECSEQAWSYGIFRLTAAMLSVQLDGKSLDLPSKRTARPIEAPTSGARVSIELPERS
jgi:hypothetical protein